MSGRLPGQGPVIRLNCLRSPRSCRSNGSIRNEVKKSSVLISPLTLTGEHNNYSLAHRLSTREMNRISQVVDLESLFGGGLQIIMENDCKCSQSLSSSQAPLT
jgi:hypothetical protein